MYAPKLNYSNRPYGTDLKRKHPFHCTITERLQCVLQQLIPLRVNWETWIDIYTLLCVKQVTDKESLYSTGISVSTL